MLLLGSGGRSRSLLSLLDGLLLLSVGNGLRLLLGCLDELLTLLSQVLLVLGHVLLLLLVEALLFLQAQSVLLLLLLVVTLLGVIGALLEKTSKPMSILKRTKRKLYREFNLPRRVSP